jgi:hypothetical protein
VILDAPHDFLHEFLALADEERRRQEDEQGPATEPADDFPGNRARQAMKAMEARVLAQQKRG